MNKTDKITLYYITIIFPAGVLYVLHFRVDRSNMGLVIHVGTRSRILLSKKTTVGTSDGDNAWRIEVPGRKWFPGVLTRTSTGKVR